MTEEEAARLTKKLRDGLGEQPRSVQRPVLPPSFIEQNQTLLAGVILQLTGAITGDHGLAAGGACVVAMCALINWHRVRRRQNND